MTETTRAQRRALMTSFEELISNALPDMQGFSFGIPASFPATPYASLFFEKGVAPMMALDRTYLLSDFRIDIYWSSSTTRGIQHDREVDIWDAYHNLVHEFGRPVRDERFEWELLPEDVETDNIIYSGQIYRVLRLAIRVTDRLGIELTSS